MNSEILDIILAVGAVVSALCVATIGLLGWVVWMAGGKPPQGKDHKVA
jgi:nitrate reductase NapE component